MKYSVLLPTRNGGKFLRNCIESILSQDYDDFELVISDNANVDETPAIVAEYSGDERVKTLRLDTTVSVTENWNAAYRASSGDYVLMMGDDDFLLPGYFTAMDAILERHAQPDCVVYNGYSFVAPGAIANDPRSFYSPHHFRFGPDLQVEQELTSRHKLGIVKDMFRWTVRIPLNMQTTLVARRAAERIKGGFFQPPFPDHYALNALLLGDARWVFSPERLVIVGVSPKSFGHYAYSNQHGAGLAYLGIATNFPGQLPGSPLINGMHVWLDRLLENYPAQLTGVTIDRPGYVRRQVYNWLLERRFGGLTTAGFMRRFGLLSVQDWVRLAATAFDLESWRRLGGMLLRRKGAAQTQWAGLRPLSEIANIKQFGDWIATTDADAIESCSARRSNPKSRHGRRAALRSLHRRTPASREKRST
jgi:glycosyltransferase involved in cell wall biosynthesis